MISLVQHSFDFFETRLGLAVGFIITLALVYRDRAVFVAKCDHIKGPPGLPL